jgi:hypothetical protein
MADEKPMGREHCDPAAEDAKAERTVLAFLLEEHPDQLTIPEVSLALNAGPADFGSEDAIERAIRELVGAGLLRCEGGFIVPTRAALCFARLDLAA